MIETQGCLDIWIDDIVPCLIDTETRGKKNTVVFKVESRTYLKKFKKKEGWHINWEKVPEDVEVYALALAENNEIQGLVGIKNDVESQAAYIHWACTAPHNNKHDFGFQKYEGVGGHLFAIAIDKSVQWGYGGAIHGYAANKELMYHYIKMFNAIYLGMRHEYQIMIDGASARKIMEVYTYEWSGKEPS